MSERSNLRLLVLAVLVASLLGTLVIRTFYLQVMTGETYRAAAEDNTVREVVEPAVRGLVLDQAGRPLVSNRTSVVVTVDRQTLKKEKDEGVEVIDRLAKILDMPAGKITERLANCGATEVIATDTLPIPPEKRFDNLTVLSIAPLLAKAIQEVFVDGSVTSLFDGVE